MGWQCGEDLPSLTLPSQPDLLYLDLPRYAHLVSPDQGAPASPRPRLCMLEGNNVIDRGLKCLLIHLLAHCSEGKFLLEFIGFVY